MAKLENRAPRPGRSSVDGPTGASTFTRPPEFIIATNDGGGTGLVCTLVGDSSPITIPLIAGQRYDLAIASTTAGNTATFKGFYT